MSHNSGYKFLFKNIGLLTIGQFGTKLLSFFLVPLYTYVLSTTEYGTYDLFFNTVSLFIPIFSLNIADAVMRFPLDEDADNNQIILIGFKHIIRSVFFLLALIAINRLMNIFPIVNVYWLYFCMLYISNSLSLVLVNLCRGLKKVKEVAISGVICTVVMIGLNILFLLPLKMGLVGYFLANSIGPLIQCVYLFVAGNIYSYIKKVKISKSIEKEMVVYSRPLMINNISWWISSASDRYIVTWLCGLAINGIYSVGYKIPSILNIFQTIFNQAWTISAVQDFDADDKNGFFTRMYNMYNFGMVAVCSVLIVLTKGIAHILYAKDFYVAWQYVPFLLLATLFGALSGYIGGIFAAVKDAKIFAKSSIIGAIVNVILNIILILLFGSIGAAISTAISYVVTWALRMMHVKKYINLKCSMTRDITTYLLLVLQGAMLFIPIQTLLIYIVECGLLILILFLNKDQLQFILNKALKKGKSGNV